MKRIEWKVAIAIITGLAMVIALSGCENLFGEEEEEDDGVLTASVSGVPGDLCGNGENTLFVAFIMNAGADVGEGGDEPVAAVGDEVESGSASGTAFLWGDDSRPTWQGNGGNSYDVYPTIYCTDGQASDGTPTVGGTPFYETDPVRVYRSAAWDQPVTYKQDGGMSITTAFSDYVP